MSLSNLSVQTPGTVSLVGAGPGDVELLTLRAWQRLRMADVVLYDNLVSPEVLALVNPQAKQVYVGKKKSNHTLPQEDICQLLVDEARQGVRVVRLKGGDPFVFGRGGEELEFVVQHGIAVEVVPGITAALGAGAAFGFPLTHRDHAQSCLFVTGHVQDNGVPLNWPALAQPNQTLVFYMGITGLDEIATQLQAAGLPATTPAALVYKATWPEQRMVVSSLQHLAQDAQQHAIKPPALLVVGGVVSLTNIKR
ncbi:uroporphyrinogen-III C-methyltransferase [Curvibacter sp. CHRR-16]|uniref:uroporphyrinogen-III C-methyltransferase n=1 Tax=Curvibacter sp. CHRR-16 TaxID=2835872 RepID=UPI001BDA67ED|nr:uroporphyrinogen-III C-methyltransferase [Curvibacter sp. CHRR-16]MBT0571334.1 uroporphyrinogen-III C-methyltransferase [Curvibacter sp. CHRR-16]